MLSQVCRKDATCKIWGGIPNSNWAVQLCFLFSAVKSGSALLPSEHSWNIFWRDVTALWLRWQAHSADPKVKIANLSSPSVTAFGIKTTALNFKIKSCSFVEIVLLLTPIGNYKFTPNLLFYKWPDYLVKNIGFGPRLKIGSMKPAMCGWERLQIGSKNFRFLLYIMISFLGLYADIPKINNTPQSIIIHI